MLRGIILLLIGALSGCRDAAPSTPTGFVPNLVGEWAVEWEDPKKKETEIIYIWFTQNGAILGGSALDPNLIPASISGEIKDLKLTVRVDPDDGAASWAAVPTSTFKGRMTGADAMEGSWSISLLSRGSWKAWRTFAVTPSVTVTTKTVVPVRFTVDEYDHLLKSMHPEAHRVGDEIEVLCTIGGIGWLHHYRITRFWLRSTTSRNEEMAQSVRAKILQALNVHGYPWKTIPE
jgi:hypothetical protein